MFFMFKIAVVIPKYGSVGGAEQFAAEPTVELCSRPDHTFQVFARRRQTIALDTRAIFPKRFLADAERAEKKYSNRFRDIDAGRTEKFRAKEMDS